MEPVRHRFSFFLKAAFAEAAILRDRLQDLVQAGILLELFLERCQGAAVLAGLLQPRKREAEVLASEAGVRLVAREYQSRQIGGACRRGLVAGLYLGDGRSVDRRRAYFHAFGI